jgi:hypothetical protein
VININGGNLNLLTNTLTNCRNFSINVFLQALNITLFQTSCELSSPPLFIVGPPRSGTTLLYQILTHSLYSSYFCNLANRFPHSAIGATYFLHKQIKNYQSDFQSHYGIINNKNAPSQSDRIWARWFGSEREYHNGNTLSENTIKEIRDNIARVENIVRAPFINKSIANSVRIQALNKIFPSCLFVWVKRDMLLTIQSQLENYSRLTPSRNWLSAKPKEYKEIQKLPLVEKICNQIFWLHRNIHNDLRKIDEKRYLTINYEEMCIDPKKCVEQVYSFWLQHGAKIEKKNDPPRSFVMSKSNKLTPEIFKEISNTLKILEINNPAPMCHSNLINIEVSHQESLLSQQR